ncbi:MAG: sensor histidine kinase [Solirubrobacteraceae bacterium]
MSAVPTRLRSHRGARRHIGASSAALEEERDATYEHDGFPSSEPPRPRRSPSLILARALSGLRLRLLAALLATSAITLAVAAVALLGPLEQRLREDGINSASAAMTATRPLFARVLANGVGGADRKALERYAFMLVRRTKGGEVALLDHKLDTLAYAPDVHTSDFPYLAYNAAKQTLKTGKQVRESQAESLTVAQTIHVGKRRYALIVVKRLAYVAAAFKVVQSAFLVAAAAGLAIALLLGIGLASRLLRRLERLRDATRSVERDGLDAALPDDRAHDEIGELSRSFTAMRRRLSRQEAARRAFVATASHELRTPLASLDGMLELLEDDLSEDALDLQDARIRTEHAREQTRRLSQLATDLLDISRLDSEVQLRREPLELGEISRAVVAEFDRIASKREVSLLVRPALGACWVAADPGAVARIVRILIDNSLHVAPPRTTIAVAPGWAEDFAEISVLDDGPGIAIEDRERIFERFTRGSASSGGFGLGLAIGRELARRMGGSLELAEQDPGAGARFTLRLPLSDHGGVGA